MAAPPTFSVAWADLDDRFQRCLAEAWASLVARGLPVGAVVSLEGSVVSVGRNRVFDPAGGSDPLQRTPLAHAEMNAIAAAGDSVALPDCELWTTHEPCSMCRAALDFTEVHAVRFLASDPSAERAGRFSSSGDADGVWIVVANTLFLHNIAWVGGRDHPMLGRNGRHEPEVVDLAMGFLGDGALVNAAAAGVVVDDALAAVWDRVTDAAGTRRRRIEHSRRA